MNIFKSKLSKEMKCVWLTSIVTFIMAFGWNIIVTIITETYEINKYGSRERAISVLNKMEQSNLKYQMILGVGTELVMLVTALIIIRKLNFKVINIHKSIKEEHDGGKGKLFVFGLITAVLLTITLLMILNIIGYARFTGSDYNNSSLKDISISLLAAIVLGISAGVEEIIFRGIILEKLLQVKGKSVALIISSIVFSINHVNRLDAGYLLYVFLIGFFLGSLYILSNSLYLSLGFHMMWNTLSYLICINGDNYINIKNSMRFNINSKVYYISIILCCGLVLQAIYFLYKKGVFSTSKCNINF